MPIEAPAGTLEVENAKFRASSVEATIAVGIGTESNDAYPLQIFKETAPDIRLSEGSTISSAARFYSNNSNLYIQTGTDFTSGSAGDVAFQTMGGQSTHMVIKSDGKVGVGTGAPVGKLQINVPDASASTATWDTTKVVLGNITNGNSQGLGFGVSTDSHASIISLAPGVAWRGLSYYSARHKWYINNVEKMTLDASGNVGIGTSEPIAPLDVMGIPYGPGARPIFSAYEYDEYIVTANGYIVLGNTFVNGLNCYNTSTGIFVAPLDGIYCFIGNCVVRSSGGSGSSTWTFHINDTNWNPTSTGRPIVYQVIDSGTNHQQTSGSLIFYLNKGDSVRIYLVNIPSNTNQNWGQGYGRFLGFLLS